MEYYDFVKYCEPDDGVTSYYAIPTTFNDFDPVSGEVILPSRDLGEDLSETYIPDDFVHLDDDEDVAYRDLAVRLHEDDFTTNVIAEGWNTLGIGRRSYLVLTDDEADSAWEASLDRYIDDCLEIPGEILPYFDRAAWKRDAKIDGRGHALSSYDGNEESVSTEMETFYLYRV